MDVVSADGHNFPKHPPVNLHQGVLFSDAKVTIPAYGVERNDRFEVILHIRQLYSVYSQYVFGFVTLGTIIT